MNLFQFLTPILTPITTKLSPPPQLYLNDMTSDHHVAKQNGQFSTLNRLDSSGVFKITDYSFL